MAAAWSIDLPSYSLILELPELVLEDFLYLRLEHVDMGRLASTSKRFRNKLLDELRRRLIEAVKLRFFPREHMEHADQFQWNEEGLTLHLVHGPLGSHHCHRTLLRAPMTIIEHNPRVKMCTEWRTGQLDRHSDDMSEANKAAVQRKQFRCCVYSVFIDRYFSGFSLHGHPETLAAKLGVGNVYPSLTIDPDSYSDGRIMHSSATIRLTKSKIPHCPVPQTTAEAQLNTSANITATFDTPFGKVKISAFAYWGPPLADECWSIIDFVMKRNPALKYFGQNDEKSTRFLLAWYRLSVTLPPPCKPMKRIANRGVWRIPRP